MSLPKSFLLLPEAVCLRLEDGVARGIGGIPMEGSRTTAVEGFEVARGNEDSEQRARCRQRSERYARMWVW